jgi:cob(I)alamin adenosyltransferase
MVLSQGYVQLYTGNGKGKTTAALGLAMRAYGAGLQTMIIQFMKGNSYSELKTLALLQDLITIEQYGSKHFYKPQDGTYIEHRDYASKGLQRAHQVLASQDFAVVILDEIVNALHHNLITYEELLELLEAKPAQVELVLTGRNAPTDLIERCDLVTEMREIKHYYQQHVPARNGIEK